MYKIRPKTLFIGKDTIYLPSCHSTNDKAAELLQNSPVSEGTVIIAGHQTQGRGQRGNVWEVLPNMNLTLSIILKPTFLTASEQFRFNIAVSLGIFDFLESYVGTPLKIKWPNDIYIQNQKMGGILIENSWQNSRLQHSIVGIGLNINQQTFGNNNATSLAKFTGQHYDLEAVFLGLLEHIENRYLQLRNGHFSLLKFNYLQNLFRYQEKHQFEADGQIFGGVIMGVSETGKLILNIENQLKEFDFQTIRYVI